MNNDETEAERIKKRKDEIMKVLNKIEEVTKKIDDNSGYGDIVIQRRNGKFVRIYVTTSDNL